MRYHDYHHPSQGSGDYCPDEYILGRMFQYPKFPSNLKRIFIPKTVKNINRDFFYYADKYYCPELIIEIDPDNSNYKVVDNKVVMK